MARDAAHFAQDYRRICDRLREKELFFHRAGRYRRPTFAGAYSSREYMGPYVDELLPAPALWYNHVAMFEMLPNRILIARRA